MPRALGLTAAVTGAAVLGAVLLAAAPALAAGPPGEVPLTGLAPAACTLPSSYEVAEVDGGASGGQFAGSTWTIPEAALADGDSQSLEGSTPAIRVAGMGFCNTSHTITLTSLNGGLTAGGGAPPAGFSNRRAMIYTAHWQVLATPTGGPGTPLGPTASLLADSPNETDVQVYTISGALPSPQSRRFDVTMSVAPQPGARMVAGSYSDTIVVSLTAQ